MPQIGPKTKSDAKRQISLHRRRCHVHSCLLCTALILRALYRLQVCAMRAMYSCSSDGAARLFRRVQLHARHPLLRQLPGRNAAAQRQFWSRSGWLSEPVVQEEPRCLYQGFSQYNQVVSVLEVRSDCPFLRGQLQVGSGASAIHGSTTLEHWEYETAALNNGTTTRYLLLMASGMHAVLSI